MLEFDCGFEDVLPPNWNTFELAVVVAGAAVFPNANPLVLLASVLFAPKAKVEDEDAEAVLEVVVLGAGAVAPEEPPLPKVNMPPELGAVVVSFLAPKLKVSFFGSLLVDPKVNED